MKVVIQIIHLHPMTKVNNKSNNKSSSNARSTGRPRPMVPKAGYTQTRRRYGEGGKT